MVAQLELTGRTHQHLVWLSKTIAIHKSMLNPWKEIQGSAQKQGFSLTIASGFRSFDRQLEIWNKKFSGELAVRDCDNQVVDVSRLNEQEKIFAILTFSALPGASRHHWGTDVDVYATNLLPQDQALQLEPWEYQDGGYFAPLSQWLAKNCQQHQFSFPYQTYQGGVAQEPWHLSYTPLAKQYQDALSLELLTETIMQADIAGKQVILDNLATIYQRYVINICEENNG